MSLQVYSENFKCILRILKLQQCKAGNKLLIAFNSHGLTCQLKK